MKEAEEEEGILSELDQETAIGVSWKSSRLRFLSFCLRRRIASSLIILSFAADLSDYGIQSVLLL